MAFNIGLEIIGIVRGATADATHSAGQVSGKLSRRLDSIVYKRMAKLADVAQETIQEIIPIDTGDLAKQVEIEENKKELIIGVTDALHETIHSETAIPGNLLGISLNVGKGIRGRLKRSRDSLGGQKLEGEPTENWISEAQEYFIGKLESGI